ncbi:choline BCCT transporter BetT [Nocardioides panacisoli]|uniref:choline BCCT transporter BetT n=1 Tax=Nocardioides panacisoli TaxID=627624 RepID=UPI001C631A9F|nr:choline BCCT transporter BetT [Nocardioides panacisoli]QYJ02925.1 choline BCCT transporter BetT [Nocardioides panacisoli]
MSIDTDPVEPRAASRDDHSGGPPARWPVFLSSVVGISLMAIWAIVAPGNAESTIFTVVDKVTTGFGWFYILLATVILGFVLFLGISRYGHVRLGPDHSRPEYSTFAWASMLFAAGIGTDVMFFSVVEPVTQYVAPPSGGAEAESVEAAREATVWTLFHYGITGWAMYALMGLALAYFAYRLNLPLAVRSALHPILGSKINGPIGHAVDTAAVLGTVFGVATSLGIGVVFLNVGLNVLFGIGVGTGAQIALAALAVGMAAVSATTGVDKGIRMLSQLNVILALGLAGWVLLTGKTTFILNAIVMNVGDFVRTFPAKTTETFAFVDNAEWMSLWTLFFWAWWIAWASFVGLFLARISRGRTIRQFVAGTMIIPFTYIVMWISIFGNAAIDRVRGGDTSFAEEAQQYDGAGFYTLLQQYPASGVVITLAFMVGLLFYVTSADSGALVTGNLSSDLRSVHDDAAPWMRIVWASVTGVLTISMLLVGGILALQYATIIFAVPFAIVLILVMWGLARALRVEGRRADSADHHLPALLSARSEHEGGRGAWRTRLARAVSFVAPEDATRHLTTVIHPALEAVAVELTERSVTASVTTGDAEDGSPWVELRSDADTHPFVYRVQLDVAPVPTYGGRVLGDRDRYGRLEVHLGDGGQDYDVMGYTETQVIHDCLDQYEQHLAFLRLE